MPRRPSSPSLPSGVSLEEVESLLEYEKDPYGFCVDLLGEDLTPEMVLSGEARFATAPWGKQIEIMESVRDNKRTIVPSSHNVGKTHIAARVGLWFLYTHYPSVVVTTAPKLSQVKDLLWARWNEALVNSKMWLGGEPLTMACYPLREEDPEWFAAGYTARDANSFSGYHESEVLFIFDEAPGVPRFIWEAVEGMLSGANCRILVIGNPITKSGPFYQSARSAEWNTIHISCAMHPNVKHKKLIYRKAVDPGWPEERARIWGMNDPRYVSRVGGQFPDAAEGELIPRAWIEAAIDREVITTEGPNVEAADVAADGPNRTVFVKIRGRRAEIQTRYVGQSTMKTTGLLARAARFNDMVSADIVGVGAGLRDRIRELEIDNFLPYNAGSKPSSKTAEEDYADLLSESYWILREEFRLTYQLVHSGEDDPYKGISICGDEAMVDQLSSRKYTTLSDGKIKVQPKKDMETGEESPDEADALVIAWWCRSRAKVRNMANQFEDDVEDVEDRGSARSLTAEMMETEL